MLYTRLALMHWYCWYHRKQRIVYDGFASQNFSVTAHRRETLVQYDIWYKAASELDQCIELSALWFSLAIISCMHVILSTLLKLVWVLILGADSLFYFLLLSKRRQLYKQQTGARFDTSEINLKERNWVGSYVVSSYMYIL